MNSERQGLIKAIVDRLDDDLPRLIFADWLEDQGDLRADFIRRQCKLARYERWMPQHDLLFQHCEELRQASEDLWRKELRVNCRIFFQRGLPHRITVGAKALSNMDPSILRHNPIGFVQITRLDPSKRELIRKSQVLDDVQGLRLSNLMPWQIVDLLPIVSEKLRRLDLSGISYTLDGSVAEAMGRTKIGERLKELYLRASRVDADFFRTLGEFGGLPGLKRLEIGGGVEVALPAHFEKLNLKRLRTFKVGGQLRVVDTEQLCHAPLCKLTSLDLRGTRLPSKGLGLLLAEGAFENTTRINLEKTNLSTKSLNMMLETKSPKCTHLNLAGNPKITSGLVRRFIDGEAFPVLKALNVSATSVKRTELDVLTNQTGAVLVC